MAWRSILLILSDSISITPSDNTRAEKTSMPVTSNDTDYEVTINRYAIPEGVDERI